MSLSRVKVWGTEVLTAADLNAEFDNILNNAASLISPLGGALDWDGFAHTLDAAGVTTAQSTASSAWTLTPGNKTGTPSTTGGITNYAASTWTDNNTANSGTATSWAGHSFQRPTLASSSTAVTTTDASTVYIANAPLAGSNETLTNPWALWIDAGNVRIDDNIHWLSGTAFKGILDHANAADRTYTFPDATGNIPTIATQAEVNAMTSTSTALTPNHNKIVLSSGTPTVTTSGTSFDFTVPSGIRGWALTLNEVSLSGTDNLLVQFGDAGGLETSGYLSTGATLAGAGTGITTATNGFVLRNGGAAQVVSGTVYGALMDTTNNLWIANFSGKASTTVAICGGGSKATSQELTTIRLTRDGTDTFDAGSINLQYWR